MAESDDRGVRWGTPAARRVLLTTVLGSSMAFLDGTVVNVALPHIRADLHTDIAGLQWVLNAYLVTLSALVLVGGSLGDRFGLRRVFVVGVVEFTVASVVCGIAPNITVLVVARGVQGIGAALLVPSSLALLTASMCDADRSRAVGAWSGLAGVAGAVGPLLGGWLVDALSWRWVFFLNVPVAAAVLVAASGVAEPVTAHDTSAHIDIPGALSAAVGLALVTAGFIGHGEAWAAPAIVVGGIALAAFVVVERTSRAPMLPLALFRNRQFAGANAVTLAMYTALGGALFLVVVQLQQALRYSAVEAGAALVPTTAMMLLLSARAGALAQKIGPRLPMTVGPLLAAAGLALFSRVAPGDHYLSAVLPAAILFGLGLSLTVAPLTAVVLASADEQHLGVASGVNNAVARLAGLIGVAVIPAVAGIDLTTPAGRGIAGYATALRVGAVLGVVASVLAAATIRRAERVDPTVQASVLQPCHDPSRLATAGTTRITEE